MARKIFVNLPVKDPNKSMGFFAKLGFNFNAQFTDEKAAYTLGRYIFTYLNSGFQDGCWLALTLVFRPNNNKVHPELLGKILSRD